MRTEAPQYPIETVTIDLAHMPPFGAAFNQDAQRQVVNYLASLVKTQNNLFKPAPMVQIPSACELSGFFQCSELHVFEALRDLANQGFEYEIRGLDGPICLRDPLARKTRKVFDPAAQAAAPHHPHETRWPWIMFRAAKPEEGLPDPTHGNA
jgi:hypothetical protein